MSLEAGTKALLDAGKIHHIMSGLLQAPGNIILEG